MSTENETIVSTEDDLDLFSAELFGQSAPEPEPASSEAVEEDHDDPDAPTEDTHGDGAEDPDDTETDESDPDPEPAPEPAKKKNRFQERIDELVGDKRETERRLDAALKALEQFTKTPEPTPVPQVPVVEDTTGPTPDDVLEDGTDKYPLGELDPNYIRDLTRHTLHEERAKLKQADEAEASQRQADTARAELQSSWNEKLGPAKERYPDLEERGAPFLADIGSKIDAAYGEYLTTVLMGLDNGPDVLNYLVNNPDKAVEIVGGGYTRATLALGAIDAKFTDAEQEKKSAKPIVSKAPTPPPHVNKGAAVSMPDVPDDTDDLDAFNLKLHPKKRA